VEGLLIAFAQAVAARGLRVGGLAQRTTRDEHGRKVGMDLVDLGGGPTRDILQKLGRESRACSLDSQGLTEATAVLRAALAVGVDLLVVSKFSHLEAQGRGLAQEMLAAMAADIPVLTLVPESHALDWLTVTGGRGQLLEPTLEACWRWWGPEGVAEALVAGVPAEAAARRVVIGFNWTLVEGPDGVGLAQTPRREALGCQPGANPGDLIGRPLRDLAAGLCGLDPLARAVGAAAVNAAWNRFDLNGEAVNGLDLFIAAAAQAERPVSVGGFPGVAEKVPGLHLIERAPGPGRLPEHAAAGLLPHADVVLLTASALANGTLPGLLARLRPGAEVILVGPGTPLAPLLADHGVTVLAGLVVEDVEGLIRTVQEGGGARHLKRHGRSVVLRAPGVCS